MRIEQLASGVAGDSSQSPVVDSTMTAQTIWPHALRYVIARMLKEGENVQNVLISQPIEMVNNVGVLPDGVMREFLDRSYLPGYPYASRIPYSDYVRNGKFDNLICYYAINAGLFYSSCASPRTIRSFPASSTMNNNNIVGALAAFTSADWGMRLQMVDGSGNIIIDAIIDSGTGTTAVMRGRAVGTAVGTAAIYDTSDDMVQRILMDNTDVTDNSVHIADTFDGDFSMADVNRRFRIQRGGTVYFDAYLSTVVDAQHADMRARALGTQTGCTTTIYYSPLLLNTPSIPVMPANVDGDVPLSDKTVDNAIDISAAVLRGDIPLSELKREAN